MVLKCIIDGEAIRTRQTEDNMR